MSNNKTEKILSTMGYYARARKCLPLLRARQKDKCGRCQELLDISNRRKYNIHHISGDISDNSIENLVLLCLSCHRRVHWDNGTQPRHYAGKVERRLGHSTVEFADVGVGHSCFKKLRLWDEIKNEPGAKYKGLGYGYITVMSCFVKYGHTSQEFADYLGVSRQRAHQLMQKGSPRIMEAKAILDAKQQADLSS